MSMTLGQIITALELIARRTWKNGSSKAGDEVHFDFCRAFPLLKIGSSRCYYERPAIDWAVRRRYDTDAKAKPPTVAELLKFLHESIGNQIQGYKGGDYTISERSPLHVDGYGECTSTVVDDVTDDDGVILVTRHEA